MSEETERNGFGTDEPIAELAGFSLEESPGFAERVERSIHRREASAGFVDLSSRGALLVAMEFLGMILSVIAPGNDNQGGKDD